MNRQRAKRQFQKLSTLTPQAMLARLLVHLFGAGGLRPFINARWPELDDRIYWQRADLEVADQVTRALDSGGYVDRSFFQALTEEVNGRPGPTRLISVVARAWLGQEADDLFRDLPDPDDDCPEPDDEPQPLPISAPRAPELAPVQAPVQAPARAPEQPPRVAAAPLAWWRFAEDPDTATVEIHLDPGAVASDGEAPARGSSIPCLFRCPALNIETSGTFVMPWGPAELAELRSALRGRSETPGPVGLRRWGLALREALRGFDTVAGAATGLPGIRLSIRSQRGSVLQLPWELLPLHSGADAQPIALEPGCSVVRRLRTRGRPRRQIPQGEAGTLLFAWSAGLGAVPAEAHAATLRGLCEQHQIPFVELGSADLPTLYAKAQELNAAGTPVRAMHLLCHGKRLSVSPELWGLALGSPQNPSTAEPAQLRTLLGNAMGALEILTLFACSAADSGEDSNPLGSVADAAFYAGVDVVAPSLPLSVRGSNLAVNAFYRALFGGASTDAAMRDTVTQLQLAGSGDHDWVALTHLEPGEGG